MIAAHSLKKLVEPEVNKKLGKMRNSNDEKCFILDNGVEDFRKAIQEFLHTVFFQKRVWKEKPYWFISRGASDAIVVLGYFFSALSEV